MSAKKVIHIEDLDSERILSEFRKVHEQLQRLERKFKFSQKEETSKPYYTRKEVKDMLGVSYPTLNSWAKTGVLKSCRIGKKVVYKAEDLENALIPMKSS